MKNSSIRFCIAAVVCATAVVSFRAFGEWKPASRPLMTEWGAKVRPDNAWREYPRPQLVRRNWTLLHFGGVDYRAQVFVNGVEVSDVPHEGGQVPFTYDITDFAKDGENELVVMVWDPTTEFLGACGKQVLKPGFISYTRRSRWARR